MAGQCATPIRVSAFSHSSMTMASPASFSANLEITYGEIRAGTRRAPCLYISTMDAGASCTFQEFVTPGTAGTKASLTITLEKADTTTGTLVCSNMRLGTVSWAGQGAPFTETSEFKYDSGDTEVLNPWVATF